LESAAEREGRSLSEEIEFRLERSLEAQLQMGAAIGLGISVGATMFEALETLARDARHEQCKEHLKINAASNSVNKVAWRAWTSGETYSPLSDKRLKKEFPDLVSALEQLREKIATLTAETEVPGTTHNELKTRSPLPRLRKPRASGQ
jgi:hypothetical protein